MLQAALASGEAHRRCVFEAFARRLPDGRRYGVVAGTGRVLEALEAVPLRRRRAALPRGRRGRRPADRRLAGGLPLLGRRQRLRRGRVLLPAVAGARRRVDLRRGRDPRDARPVDPQPRHGDRVGRLPHDDGRRGRPCIEMGSRRTHEESAVAAARAAYIAGFEATSNLEAGRRYGVPTTGTAAHAFTLLYDSEKEAFTAQVDSLGKGTTLLVDTYDVRTAVALADRDRRARAGRGPARLRRPAHPGHRGPRPARRGRQHRHPHHRHVRPRRVRHRRPRGRSGQRLRRRHRARDRLGRAHGIDGLQARPARGRVGAHAGRREEEQGQDVGRRPQVGDAPARRLRRRPGRGHRHRRARRATTATTDRSWSTSSAPARSSTTRTSTRHAPGTRPSRAELPRAAAQLSRGEPVIPTIYEED